MLYHNFRVTHLDVAIVDYGERLAQLRAIVNSLPTANYFTLKRLMQHFDR